MRQCAFTIVAKNYIGLGQILGKSLREHNPEVDFRIYVSDEFETVPVGLPSEVIIARDVIRDITPEEWTDMSFKYDLTEFCTSIKPFCFEHVFSEGYDKAYYFDPDIYIFSGIGEISRSLDTHSMTLTPQIAGIHVKYQGEHPEWAMNVNGIFNLGFCGIRNNQWGNLVVQWWKERLRDNAFTDRSVGEFTDQKWMDWVPAFLGDELCVQKSLGMNMAPWNFFERKAYKTPDGQWRVTFRTDDVPQRDDVLVFIHFAGYDYSKLKQGIIARKRIEDLQEYDDITLVSGIYRDAIVSNAVTFDSFITQPYSYSAYDNGVKIAAFHRRLYHGLEDRPANPFSTARGSFYDAIFRKGMIVSENIDNASRRNVGNMEGKQRMLSWLYRALYMVMGYKRYVMFLKSLYFYCRPEMHTFLLKKRQDMNSPLILLLLLILFMPVATTMAADDENMPIIAYMGVPYDKGTDMNFRDFRNCGFDVSLYGYESLQQLTAACRTAHRQGVKILGHCPESHKNPEAAARILSQEKGFFGYVLEDEPSAERIRELQKEIVRLQIVDREHPFYINLHPFYADWTLIHTKTDTYEEYLRVASSTSCQQISFDFYPVEKEGLRQNWYQNLEMVRQESLLSGKPFWAFVLSVPHCNYPQPTLATLRLQIYSNLAYGAQAIQYFTYWTPAPTKDWDFHDAPISLDGRKTKTYYLVQKMNRELRPIANLFHKARVSSVSHLGRVPVHANRLRKLPAGISKIRVDAQRGAIVSQFTKEGRQYMAIVNKDYTAPMILHIRTRAGVEKLNKDMTTEQPVSTYEVEPGDIVLFKLK